MAFDTDTRLIAWQTNVRAPVRSVAVAGGRVLATTAAGAAALDAQTGRVLWTHASPPAHGGAGIDRTFACYGSGDTLHILDAATGDRLRQVTAAGSVVVDRGMACVSGFTTGGPKSLQMSGVDLATGDVRWRWRYAAPDAPPDPLSDGSRAYGPVLADGAVYVSFANTLCALDAATGHERWRWAWRASAPAAGAKPASPAPPTWRALGVPAVIGGVVYVASADDLTGLDPATGRQVWRFEAEGRSNAGALSVPPFAADGLLLGVVGDHDLCAIVDDLHPASPRPAVVPAARGLDVRRATAVASSAALLLIILAVLGWWRAEIALTSSCLCALTVWGWARSYAADDFVGHRELKRVAPFEAQTTRGVTSTRGRLIFGLKQAVWNTSGGRRAAGATKDTWVWTRTPQDDLTPPGRGAGLLDFRWTKRSRPSGTSVGQQAETSLTLPHWPVAALLGVAPLAWLTGLWRDRRRHPPGHCRACGYDLRGIAGRCPECGLEIPMALPRRKRARS
jgi:hypothetical protein